jgi:PPOX class probable F420-dependent enzyme
MSHDQWIKEFLRQARVGHLATSTKDGTPHVVPICYAFDSKAIYSAIDEKPKQVTPAKLRRVKNIIKNSNVALIVDLYSEDWRELQYVLVQGVAQIVQGGKEHEYAISLLRQKYPQYHSMNLEDRPMLRINPSRIMGWKAKGLAA